MVPALTSGAVAGLVCMRCSRRYRRGLDGPCPRCGPEGVLEIEFANTGTFMFHAHQSEFAELGWMGFFEVEG